MRRRTFTTAFVLALSCAGPCLAGSRAQAGEAAERAHAILAAGGYQTQRPAGDTPDRPHAGAHPGRIELPAAGGDEEAPAEAPGSTGLRSVALAGLWVLLGVGAILLVVLILRAFGALGGVRMDRGAAGGAVDDPEEGPALVSADDDVEALARAGRYADAVHVLLLRALAHLFSLAGRPAGHSSTSREILAALELDPAQRTALADLVLAVEVSRFGGVPVEREAYERCALSYRTVTA